VGVGGSQALDADGEAGRRGHGNHRVKPVERVERGERACDGGVFSRRPHEPQGCH